MEDKGSNVWEIEGWFPEKGGKKVSDSQRLESSYAIRQPEIKGLQYDQLKYAASSPQRK